MINPILKAFLDEQVLRHNKFSFIENDPISIPHFFTKKQDIEIAGLFATLFAWGNRTAIIMSAKRLMVMMDNEPYNFVMHHTKADLMKLSGFVHRTFNETDLLYFIEFLKSHYSNHSSIEEAFCTEEYYDFPTVEHALKRFHQYFFSFPHLKRTEKHIPTPAKNSACKRLNLYLRWMVRKDVSGVDFGIWQKLKPRHLIIPLDLHVIRIALSLGLMDKPNPNWKNALILTEKLRQMNAEDPIIYDFALFGIGIEQKKSTK